MDRDNEKKKVKNKGFFARIFDKLDKKMETQVKKGGCCCSNTADNKEDSCCS